MKTKAGIIILFCLLFASCEYQPPDYSLAVSIDTDNTTTLEQNPVTHSNYISSKKEAVIKGHYSWIPSSPKDQSVKKIISTDENIISISSVDYNNCTFTALAKNEGNAKIRVFMNDGKYSSSLIIYVK